MIEFFDLFWTFIKIGFYTFGGGYAMIPVLERELIKKKGWITMDETLDYYTIAQVTPGIIAVNISTFVGYKRNGIAGGVIATMGFILPGVALMTIISIFIKRFAEYPVVQHAFAGIRIAVGALILDTIRKLLVNLFKAPARRGADNGAFVFFAAVFAAAFVLSAFFSASAALIVLAAGWAGFLCFRPHGFRPSRGDAS
ncbi:MAG: chromate transporter [Treponema sp.]|nr:chromate transporter [Treponema sp.]